MCHALSRVITIDLKIINLFIINIDFIIVKSMVITQLLLVTSASHRHFLLSCGPTVTALDGKHDDCHTFNLIYSSLGVNMLIEGRDLDGGENLSS